MTRTSATDDPGAAVRRSLEERGYALRLRTERDDDTLTATLTLEDVEEERSLLKVVAAGRLEDLDVSVGLDASEEGLQGLLQRLLGLWGAVRVTLPGEDDEEEAVP